MLGLGICHIARSKYFGQSVPIRVPQAQKADLAQPDAFPCQQFEPACMRTAPRTILIVVDFTNTTWLFDLRIS